jgi:hypothetical protein
MFVLQYLFILEHRSLDFTKHKLCVNIAFKTVIYSNKILITKLKKFVF